MLGEVNDRPREVSPMRFSSKTPCGLAWFVRMLCCSLIVAANASYSGTARTMGSEASANASSAAPNRPNIVLIFADDLGYGDLGCFGETRWKTPHLDSIAARGVRFTDFHSSQPVCSASRASLLTGCYANRIGIHGALFPASKNGIHEDETLLPELLKPLGYRTGMVGKWHLGHHEKFLPLQHGFDEYLGLPYSNDMWPHGAVAKPSTFPPLPLFHGNEVIDEDVDAEDQKLLTQSYADFAIDFIRRAPKDPFFLYYAHTFPHVPLFVGAEHAGRSKAGIYGDVLEEFDDSVGRILRELDTHGLTENTLVIFTSDNGPWLTYGDHAGTARGLREGKGTVYEGGVRVPMVAQWPSKIPAGCVQSETAMTIDLFPTIARIVGAPLPNRKIDGLDIFDLLTCRPEAKCPHEVFYHYYRVNELQAIRSGVWKLMLPHEVLCIDPKYAGSGGKPGKSVPRKITEPELYRLDVDLAETNNLADKEPEVMARLLRYRDDARKDLGDSLVKVQGSGVRESGMFSP